MAAHFQEETHVQNECHNCGATDDLALCSRCHAAHFCSRKCQKAYWPFHREWCHRNDFADEVERTQPKFARFLRKHGKQAVLKDDEVDRLERKVVGMPSMYGRANPKPEPPLFDAEDMRKMREAEERSILKLRAADADATARTLGAGDASFVHDAAGMSGDPVWGEIVVPANLGADHGQLKWRQNQTFVEVFVKLPPNAQRAADVAVVMRSDFLSVKVAGVTILAGALYRPIKAEASTWIIADGILEICLLKRFRRGNYENGKSNADTFWFCLCRDGGGVGQQRIEKLTAPPNEYYDTEYTHDPEDNEPPQYKKKSISGGGKRGK